MGDVLLVQALETFEDLVEGFEGLLEGVHFGGELTLVFEDVTLVAVLSEDQDDLFFGSYVRGGRY